MDAIFERGHIRSCNLITLTACGRPCTRGGVESQSSPQIAGLYQSVFDMFDLRASVGLAGQLEERARNDFGSRARRLTSGTCNDVILDSRYVSKSA